MLDISHDSRAHRLSIQLEGQTALLDYQLDRNVMKITHTRVPREIGGRGVAAELMRGALKIAAEHGWTVLPVCSYAVAFMNRQPPQANDA